MLNRLKMLPFILNIVIIIKSVCGDIGTIFMDQNICHMIRLPSEILISEEKICIKKIDCLKTQKKVSCFC